MYMGLHLASFRGTQGTGVGLVADDGEITVNKTHLASVDFLRTEMWDFVESNLMNSHVIMGHTRFPTFSNTVHAKNAQPFCYDNTDKSRTVLLTHNGHINSHHDLTKGIKGFTHPVDSAHVARAMAETTNPKDLLVDMRGNYALVWYDEQRRLVCAANNGGRELWMAPSKNKEQMYYCSERTMLKFCLDRAGIDYKEIVEVPEMQCLYWELDAKETAVGKFFKYKEKPFVSAYVTQESKWKGGGGGHSVKKGSEVWASMRPDTSLTLYPDTSPGKKSEYGRMLCTVPSSMGSVCEIEGVKKATFDDVLVPLFSKNGNTFPCRVNNYEMEDGPDGKKFPLYKVSIDMNKLDQEVSRLKNRGIAPAIYSVNGVPQNTPQLVPGPGKSVKITKDAWDKVAREGCFYCQGDIHPSDVGKIGWQLVNTSLTGEDQYRGICPPCVVQIETGELSPVIDKAL